MKHGFFTTLLNPSYNYCHASYARIIHEVFRRADLYDSGIQKQVPNLINVWTKPANILKNKVIFRQFIHSVAFVN